MKYATMNVTGYVEGLGIAVSVVGNHHTTPSEGMYEYYEALRRWLNRSDDHIFWINNFCAYAFVKDANRIPELMKLTGFPEEDKER